MNRHVLSKKIKLVIIKTSHRREKAQVQNAALLNSTKQ